MWRLRIGPWYLVVMKSNRTAPCGLGAGLQAYIKSDHCWLSIHHIGANVPTPG